MSIAPLLSIDFGTSHTVAALRHASGNVESVLFDGSPLLPSAVFAEADGLLTVGGDARDAARRDPARFEPHPKRRVDDGTVLLGDLEFAVCDLFAAVLSKVRAECGRILGTAPNAVTLTHPAAWGPTRRLVLEDAAKAAGFVSVTLLPEPVAAATYYATALKHLVPVGAAVVVHDFGGGTFDASVVRRSQTGFEVLVVDGLDDLGGIDIDAAIVGHLEGHFGADEGWRRLLTPATPVQWRQWQSLYDEVRQAKERLSRHSSADLFIPVIDRELHLTRAELDALTRPLLARATRMVAAVIRSARLPESSVVGIFLVGGASRMPLVSTMLHQETGRPPTMIDRLEQVVAHGALLAPPTAEAPEPPQWKYEPAQPPQPARQPLNAARAAPTPTPTPTPQQSVRPLASAPQPALRKERMPWLLGWFAVALVFQALPMSDLIYDAFYNADEHLLYFLNAGRGLVLACVPLLWVRRPWAWWALVAAQAVLMPVLVLVPVLQTLGLLG
ncbi:Hsp70 family protein [Glycomyces harbinensis]|uniref:Hsp70 protein n=1 Tax=Glycomyces harbinensis TaxID=58114 RepID=A0A1G6ZJ69_9ACTN|nr:Hsp70 family protein [Glycomyces harbinensis]SDE02551.1 Hsp70 protein [Glycomyces harbinensis]